MLHHLNESNPLVAPWSTSSPSPQAPNPPAGASAVSPPLKALLLTTGTLVVSLLASPLLPGRRQCRPTVCPSGAVGSEPRPLLLPWLS